MTTSVLPCFVMTVYLHRVSKKRSAFGLL